MRNQAASRPPRRMLHVQHLVKQHVLHGITRHTRSVQPPIQHDLVRSRIVAAELPPPRPPAPAKMRPLQPPFEVSAAEGPANLPPNAERSPRVLPRPRAAPARALRARRARTG